MSRARSGLGKPLKGISATAISLANEVSDTIISSIISGSTEFDNVNITGGVINGVVIGNDSPGPVYTTSLISGTPDGTGYSVIFYGSTIGTSVSWNPISATWNVAGNLSVTGTSDLGNIRIFGNNIQAINTNGNINLIPNGTGKLTISSAIQHSTNDGDLTYNTLNGLYSLDVSKTITQESGLNQYYNTDNGSIVLKTGNSISTGNIIFISTGATSTITTTSAHNLLVNDEVNITSTNSTPALSGKYTVTATPTTTTFQIQPASPITISGNTGTFTKSNNIFLKATDNVIIPNLIPLTFGDKNSNTQKIYGNDTTNNLTLEAGNQINLSPTSSVNIQNNIPLFFNTSKIQATNNDIGITAGTSGTIKLNNNTLIDGDLTVNGTTTTINSTTITLDDVILTLGGDTAAVIDDSKDRGIAYQWNNGTTSKLGYFGFDRSTQYFTYIPDATITGEVVSGTPGNALFNNVLLNGDITVNNQLNTCNIYCAGNLNLTGLTGITLNSNANTNITIPESVNLQFGTNANNKISSTDSNNLLINGNNDIRLTPTNGDITIPSTKKLSLNGPTKTSFITSDASNIITLQGNNLINILSTSGGVKLTENQPLIFNNANTSKITGATNGDLNINSSNNINLTPASGQVVLPLDKKVQWSTTEYISGLTGGNLILNSSNQINQIANSNINLTSTTGNIFLNPLSSVNIPVDKSLIFGNNTEYIKSDVSSNLLLNSSNNIYLTPNNSIIVPITKPIEFGNSLQNINGTTNTLNINANVDINNTATNFKINGTTTQINTTNTLFLDPILTIGGITAPGSNDNKDKGIEYRWHNGTTSKLGWFGYDISQDLFTFIKDATNTNEVISGSVGNVSFGSGLFTNLNLQNGAINNVNTITSASNLTLTPTTDLIFNLASGNNISIPPNVDLLFNGEQAKLYSDGLDLHGYVQSPGKFIIDGNQQINGDLTVTGNLILTGNPVATNYLTQETLTVNGGGVANPSNTVNITFINITSSGTVTGTMPTATITGFLKIIIVYSTNTAAIYNLIFPTGRMVDSGIGVSGSGTTAAKQTSMYSGNSFTFVWNNSFNTYFLINGGAKMTSYP